MGSLCFDPPMSFEKREQASPVGRLLCQRTDDLIGWLYQWNNRELDVRWKDGPCSDVYIDELSFVGGSKNDAEQFVKGLPSLG